MQALQEIITQIELHSPEGIRKCFEHGIDPNVHFRGEPLIYELTSEYTRSPGFIECVKVFVDYGLEFEDKTLLSVLMDDAESLKTMIGKNPESIFSRHTLRCAYTPLLEASLLHICAEFNLLKCASVLVQNGLSVDDKAGTDEYGFGGQTPIFHTVNQNTNQSAGMMDFLLSESVDLEITVKSLVWGKGYEWETLIPAVNPISYAMMGLLPQMHRDEITTHKIVSKLLKHRFGINYLSPNIPCKYLSGK